MMHVHIFWTYSGSRLSKLVKAAQGGEWTHCGLLFVDKNGNRYAFEARSTEGWVGPYDFAQTENYIHDVGGKMIVSATLPFTEFEAGEAYRRAMDLHETSKPYSYWQLVWIWLANRYGVRVPHSPDKLICSEGTARPLEYLGPFPEWRHVDAITPISLWRSVTEAIAYSHGLAFGPAAVTVREE